MRRAGPDMGTMAAATAAASLLAAWLGDRLGMLAMGSADPVGELFGTAMRHLPSDLASRPLAVSLEPLPALTALSAFCGTWAIYAWALSSRKAWRDGEEYGSARRGRWQDALAFRDPRDPMNNIVVSEHVGIAITPNERVRERIASRNVLVVGGTGTGKTTGYVMPNIMQVGSGRDMVVVDPKGTTLSRCGALLARSGVDVRVFDMVDTARSDLWNPLATLSGYDDVSTLVRCLITNTNGGRESSDPIWDNGEALLYKAVLTFMLDWCRPSDMTMRTFLELVDMCDAGPEEGARSPLDLLFSQIETGMRPTLAEPAVAGPAGRAARGRRELRWEPTRLRRRRDGLDPHDWVDATGARRRGMQPSEDQALRAWRQFTSAPGRTLQSFVVSAHARLSFMDDPEVTRILAGEARGRDDLRLDLLGQARDELGREVRPKVVFVISSDFRDSLNGLLSILMWQAVFLPMDAADRRCGGALPRPVSIVIDEFANVGKIPAFRQCISVVRSRNVDISVVVQSLSQIDDVYGREAAATIRENCPTTLLLGGGRGFSTAERISREVGRGTYDKASTSRRGGPLGESTRSEDRYGRDVMDPHEVATLPGDRALVLIGDREAIVDGKARCWAHPLYDPEFMAEGGRACDYAAWRAAGRPMGAAAQRWLASTRQA